MVAKGRGRGPPTLFAPLLATKTTADDPDLSDLLLAAETRAADDPAGAVEVLAADADRCRADPDEGRLAVVLAAAGLTLQDAGWLGPARARFAAAAEAARASEDDETLAVAALGLGGVWVHEHRSTVERAHVIQLQTEAVEALPPWSPLAVRLRARLDAEQAYIKGDATALSAVLDEVRALDEPIALAEALSLVHHCLLGPENGRIRLALADELLAVSAGTGRRLDAILGLAWRTVDLFLAGDAHAERSLNELRARTEVATAACVAYLVAALDVMLAIRAGRLGDAEAMAEACYELGSEVGDADALGWYGAHVATIRWFQGRAAEVLPLVSDLAYSPTMAEPNDAFMAAVAVTAAAAGQTDAARGALDRIRGSSLAALRSSSTWLVTMFGVAEAADLLADADAGRDAYALLAPFASLPVMASLAVTCFGSTHRPLGLAAAATGDLDLAIDHLEAACAADRRLGNLPSAVLATVRLAGVLRRRDGSGDEERADKLERDAAEEARRIGIVAMRDLAPAAIEFVRRGREWSVRVGARMVFVRHSVGMTYLAELVARAGVQIAAAELAGGHQTPVGARRQPVLDDRARASYRHRIQELQSDIDDADRDADIERAAVARIELDQLTEELARVTGLGGRSRSFDDASERARTSVQKAIRRAIAEVAEADPVLGRQLERSVVTGVRCAFLPGGMVGT